MTGYLACTPILYVNAVPQKREKRASVSPEQESIVSHHVMSRGVSILSRAISALNQWAISPARHESCCILLCSPQAKLDLVRSPAHHNRFLRQMLNLCHILVFILNTFHVRAREAKVNRIPSLSQRDPRVDKQLPLHNHIVSSQAYPMLVRRCPCSLRTFQGRHSKWGKLPTPMPIEVGPQLWLTLPVYPAMPSQLSPVRGIR